MARSATTPEEEEALRVFMQSMSDRENTPPTELDWELAMYLTRGALGGKAVKHPLVFEIFYSASNWENQRLNARLVLLKARAAKYLERGSYEGYVYTHEAPYRLQVLAEIAHRMTPQHYYRLLGYVFTEVENVSQYPNDYLRILFNQMHDTAYRPLVMHNKQERETLAFLPETLTVYRGYNGSERGSRRRGWSWTLSLRVAWFFARRLSRESSPARVIIAQVPKNKVIAYYGGRSEQEIIVDPKFVGRAKDAPEIPPNSETGSF
jgi:hypothetical protein